MSWSYKCIQVTCNIFIFEFYGLVQDCSISIPNALLIHSQSEPVQGKNSPMIFHLELKFCSYGIFAVTLFLITRTLHNFAHILWDMVATNVQKLKKNDNFVITLTNGTNQYYCLNLFWGCTSSHKWASGPQWPSHSMLKSVASDCQAQTLFIYSETEGHTCMSMKGTSKCRTTYVTQVKMSEMKVCWEDKVSGSLKSFIMINNTCIIHDIDGLVQDCRNSIANTLELLQSYTKPLV